MQNSGNMDVAAKITICGATDRTGSMNCGKAPKRITALWDSRVAG